jgi:hypothetical protein
MTASQRRSRKTKQELPEVSIGRTARTFINATRPDGVAVVFLPGELLPNWLELDAADEAR